MPSIIVTPARHRRRPPTWGNWFTLLLLLALALVASQLPLARRGASASPPISAHAGQVVSWARRALQAGFPLLAFSTGEEASGNTLGRAVQSLAGVNLLDPRSILGSQLALLEAAGEDENQPALVWPGEALPPPAAAPPQEYSDPPAPGPAEAEPLVGVYNTHNAESYLPSQGKEKLQGKNGGVALVAQSIAEALESSGVNALRSTAIHDDPDFNRSYLNSERTVRRMLQDNPGLAALVDVHRDAGVGERETVKIEGQAAARIMIIIGSDARQEFSTWRQNLDFARKLETRLNQLYPGLSKGVRVQDGRYNQHLHPRAILVEVGSSRNSLEEAQRSARLLARALADVIRQVQGGPRI